MLKPESFPIFADWAHGDYVCESVLLLLTSDYSVKEMLGGAGIARKYKGSDVNKLLLERQIQLCVVDLRIIQFSCLVTGMLILFPFVLHDEFE